ncbi:hypothetical protein DSO57_1004645 [Entomophthora muscae]|uniref:Uncharacterized protein n=1 Tax=Entomophthora muscae TaxID=34485 RepID=A0ACC2SL24_9FUNG|nr:hypothetical protein DSO57_1004645 [Entomophthora muscae]
MKGLAILQVFAVVAEYDYIVVGSGPGGGTLATELAIKGFNTLLIEAGPHHFEANQSTPAFHARASEDPFTTFSFSVKHYDNDVRYFYPRAGALGGCAVHNAMISVYPNSRDFEMMKRITRDDGWAEGNMRKYFKRMENNQYLVSKLLNPSNGFGGWFKTSYINFLLQLKLDPMLVNYVIATIGTPLRNINSYGPLGKLSTDCEGRIFIPQAVDKTSYTRTNFPKYIYEVAKHFPLTIWTNTFVTQVLFEGKTAVGVKYRKGKYLYNASPFSTERKRASFGAVYAKKEIIISGGTFNTPQLLMLSGIGDKNHLKEFNIPVVSHVPGVGRNMMDRYEVPIVLQYPTKFNLLKDCKFTPTQDDPCYVEYLRERSGPYTSNGILSGHLKKSNPWLNEPDIFVLSSLSDFHGYFKGYSNIIAKRTDSTTSLILKAHTNNTNGRVKLLSSNPFDVPDINFHSFSDGDSDLNILVDAIKEERKYLNKIFVSHVELFPGPHIQTDRQIKKFIKDHAWGHHACCTAKMGTSHDPNAVVDAKFRVRGVKNLRVVDMSIFPKIPGYFPAVYIHMMAMKAADDITT